MTLRLIASLGYIGAFALGWWLGRDFEWRLWEQDRRDAEDDDYLASVQLDPVPMKTTEVLAMLTCNWDLDLAHEWEHNR